MPVIRWLQFIFSHSIFIALCAVALCYQSYTLLRMPPNYFVYGTLFFSTLCSYNFYWLISKFSFSNPLQDEKFLVKNRSYIFLFLLAGLGMVACIFFVPVILPYLLVGVLLTLIYSLPLWPFPFALKFRKAGFLKTTLLAFTWAYVTTVIPLVTEVNVSMEQLLLLLLSRFFFMLLLCAIFDMRDRRIDKMNALHSLATDLSRQSFKLLMMLVFFLFLGIGVVLRFLIGDTAQFAAFIVTGVAVWIVYRYSLKQQGYLFYYFIVDGLMLFAALTTYVASLSCFS